MSADMIYSAAPAPPVEQVQAISSLTASVQPAAREIRHEPAQAPRTPPVLESVAKAAQQLNEVMETFNKGIRFRMFENTGRMYVQIVNRETQEVIRTIPPEELLKAMEKLHEVLGMILDARG
ncbi:MAG: flagellar protein FlaG [Planctomycetota bacterium]|nr:flagellar protein FlaG [Planctomycetota bacterium]